MNASNEKKSFRFNIIDLLIILTVAALLVSAILRYQSETILPSTEDQVNVEVEFLIQNMSTDLFSSVVIGDTVVTENEKTMGVLKSADFQKAELYYTGDDGVPVLTWSDSYYDVRCVLTAEGVQSERGFLLGGEDYLAPGQILTVKTPHLTVDVLITDINIIN